MASTSVCGEERREREEKEEEEEEKDEDEEVRKRVCPPSKLSFK